MKKRNLLLTFVLGLVSINFVSAYYGSYNNFSLSGFLNNFDSQTILLIITFIISFALINLALVRVFRDNKATPGIISFSIALLITYGLNRTGFNLEGLFYNIGFSGGILNSFIPLILLGGIIFLIWKFKKNSLFIMGILLILISFTELIYEKGLTLIMGIILIGIGFWLYNKKEIPAFAERYGR
jgi:hypothetical protein